MAQLLEIVNKRKEVNTDGDFKTGFGGLRKLEEVRKAGFPTLEKKDIVSWLDENIRDSYELDQNHIDLLAKQYGLDSVRFDWKGELVSNVGGDSYKIKSLNNSLKKNTHIEENFNTGEIKIINDHVYDKQSYILSDNKNKIATKIIQYGFGLLEVGLIQTDVEDYNEIPPAHIVALEQRASELNVFDNIKVIEPMQKEVKSKKLILDPVLVGTLDSFPNIYFIIGVWDRNIETGLYLKDGPKSLIEESYKFFGEFPNYKDIGLKILKGADPLLIT